VHNIFAKNYSYKYFALQAAILEAEYIKSL